MTTVNACVWEWLMSCGGNVPLSSLFEEKFDERKNNYFLWSSEEEDKEEDKKEGAKNETMESQQRKIIEENFSFRVLYQKKGPHKTFAFFTRKNNKARARGCACVCVCVDLERRE